MSFRSEDPDGRCAGDPDEDLRRPGALGGGRLGAGRAHRRRGAAGAAAGRVPHPSLPPLGPWERIVADYRTTGMTLGRHPMELIRET